MTEYSLSPEELERLDRDELLTAGWWCTAQFEFIHVTKMTDAHLNNALRHIEDRAEMWEAEHNAASSYCPASSDSMASYYADHAANDAWESALWCRSWAKALAEEIKRRSASKQGV